MAGIVVNLRSISRLLGIPLKFSRSRPTICSPTHLRAIVMNFEELKTVYQGTHEGSQYIKTRKYDMNNWNFFLVQAYLHEVCHWKQFIKYGRNWYKNSMNDEYAEQIAHKFAVRYSKKYRILV